MNIIELIDILYNANKLHGYVSIEYVVLSYWNILGPTTAFYL